MLARVSEGRVSEVVGQRNRFRQILVHPERPGNRASDLRDFQRVRQPRAVVIALRVEEHLGFVLQAPKRAGVQHAVAVFLEDGAKLALVTSV